MKRFLALSVVLLTGLASAVGLGCDEKKDGGTPSGATATGAGGAKTETLQTFRFINRNDVITLDLNQMSYMQDFRVTYALREGLYTYDPRTMKAVPALATEVTTSPDQRVWTFKLREAKWSNGDPVTAHDFMFSWRHMLQAPGEYTSLFYYFLNAEEYEKAYTQGKPTDGIDLGFRAIDDRTIELRLKDPLPFLTDLLAFPPMYPRNEKSMLAFKEVSRDGKVTYKPEYTKPSPGPGKPGVVTNGPFELVEWEFGRILMMKRSPTYWDVANVASPALEMVVSNDPQQAFNMYEQGEIQWITDPTPQQSVDLKEAGRKDLQVGPGFGTHFITVNCAPEVPGVIKGKNPLADVRVRRALNLAIDKKAIVDTITRMGEVPAKSYMPPGLFEGFEPKPGADFNVEAARKLLAEAGYPGGKGFPSISIVFNTDSPVRPSVAQFLKNEWQKKLGIPIEVKGIELKGYRAAIKGKDYALGLAAWFGDYTDPSTFTDKYRSSAQNNDSNWAVAAYDKLLDDAAKEIDPAKRFDLLERAEDMINDELPVIPMWHAVAVTLRKDNVEGLYLNPKQLTMWKPVRATK